MKRLFLFLTVAAAVCCAACSDDPEVAESNLSLLEDNVTFDMFGGRSVLEITADSPWTVSCDDDWCRTNVAEGSHTKKIVLTVDQSFLPEERTTAVRFYAAGEEKHTVTVTQEKFEPILVLAEDGADITVYGAGSEPALNLRASVAWKIEGATDWCAVSQSEGTKSSVVKLLLTDDGEGVRPRSATLTVFSEMEGVEPQQVTVVQRSTGANTVVVRAGETRAFPARRTDGAYVKGVAADWVWTTDAELLSGLDYDASRNEITCTAAKSKQGSGLVALFDAEGAVVWSWLVWVVDKMPSDVTVGGIAWQDRNVGAEWQSLLAYVDGNAAKNQDSGDTYSRWYALNSGGTLIGPSTMFRKGDNGRIHYPGRSAAYCSSTLAGGKPLPMYDWKAGDATGEGTYYERKMTTAYGMRCVKE